MGCNVIKDLRVLGSRLCEPELRDFLLPIFDATGQTVAKVACTGERMALLKGWLAELFAEPLWTLWIISAGAKIQKKPRAYPGSPHGNGMGPCSGPTQAMGDLCFTVLRADKNALIQPRWPGALLQPRLSLLAIKQLVPWLNSLPQGLKEVQVVQVQDMRTPKKLAEPRLFAALRGNPHEVQSPWSTCNFVATSGRLERRGLGHMPSVLTSSWRLAYHRLKTDPAQGLDAQQQPVPARHRWTYVSNCRKRYKASPCSRRPDQLSIILAAPEMFPTQEKAPKKAAGCQSELDPVPCPVLSEQLQVAMESLGLPLTPQEKAPKKAAGCQSELDPVLSKQLQVAMESLALPLTPQVQGEFVVHFECYDFPIDIQSLTVLLEFQLADEGITPVELSTSHTQDVDVNRQNFAWENEYELGLSMSVGMAKRHALSTRTYPHVMCSAWVLRNPFYFLVNVALPNMLFAAMAGLQFFVDVDKVADRASISLTLLLVCASYFQFSSSLVPRLGYLTILDKHSLWCIFLVIVMVFWVGIIKMVRHHTALVDFMAASCFAGIWLLSHGWFLLRLWRSRRRSRSRLERPAGSHQRAVRCRQNSDIFYPVSPRPDMDLPHGEPKAFAVNTAWQ
ncbi:unnamed protein product [Cladocopium goreaui]|uniref:Nuclear localization sequence-binding protein n=1 Tax=Cladocopium goreaui TaxID=2562237 RepID=A0A9P1CWT6_9DINO|nr:unnamed protein product [Cladocopium goreaui]